MTGEQTRARDSVRWHHEIVDSMHRPCGRFDAAICRDLAHLEHCIRFNDLPGGFARYRANIPLNTIYPLAVLLNLEIDENRRKSGFGRSGLDHFCRQAVQRGAVLAIGKVGWPPTEEWESHKERNLRFYRDAGWVLLARQGFEPYFVYKAL